MAHLQTSVNSSGTFVDFILKVFVRYTRGAIDSNSLIQQLTIKLRLVYQNLH